MLIEFSVANFRSIKEKVTLSLVASSSSEHFETHTSSMPSTDISVLRSAAIYGPNAAGKSNILHAFKFMRDQVVGSATSQRGDKIKVSPHLFDVDTVSEPTEVEAIFVVDGIRYQYGFSATKERIMDEWLYAYPKNRAQRWISREYDPESATYRNNFSLKLLGQKQIWVEAARDNALLLSTAVQLNSTQLTPIFDWFKDKTRVIGFQENFRDFTALLCEKQENRSYFTQFLKAADLNIDDLSIDKSKIDISKLPDDMPESIKKQISEKEYLEVSTIHKVKGGASVSINLQEESDGTQKFFGLIGPWCDILGRGMTVFVDELHGSLHPLMVRFLISWFHSNEINKCGAQLIFTTHDTTILNQDFLRRDQVWFVEKKEDNSTRLFPLTTFSPRKGRDDIERNYLLGRYGALPYFREVASAMGVVHGE